MSELKPTDDPIEAAKRIADDERKRWEREADSVSSVESAVRCAYMAFACGEVAKKINDLRERPPGPASDAPSAEEVERAADSKRVGEIIDRISPTICPTYCNGTMSEQGRILRADFEWLFSYIATLHAALAAMGRK